jgi:hypothetical protein
MGTSFTISELYVSYLTEQKLIHKHQISVDEVEQAIVGVRGLSGAWDDDPERGRRLIVRVTIRTKRAIVVLYPRDDPSEWNLGSAYFTH